MQDDPGKLPPPTEEDPLLEVSPEGVSLPAWQPLRLSARHLMMIELHLQGFKNTEIADTMGCHAVTVGLVLRSQPAQDMLRERVEHVNLDFQAQFRQVVDTFSDALSPDATIDVRLAAADKWLKAHGHYQPKEKKKGPEKLTIEDVISEMKAGTVTVNIDNRKQTYYSGPPTEGGRRDGHVGDERASLDEIRRRVKELNDGGEKWQAEQTARSVKSPEGSDQEQDQSPAERDRPRSITSGRG